MTDGLRVMALLDEDAAIEGTGRRPLAELYRVRIGEAMEAWRYNRKPAVLWSDALHALGATRGCGPPLERYYHRIQNFRTGPSTP